MALIKCSECGNMISDKSESCVHCGAPIELKENLISCPECSALIDDTAERCPMCGYPVIPKRKLTPCPECGKMVEEDTEECPECGYPMTKQIEESKEPPLCDTALNKNSSSISSMKVYIYSIIIGLAILFFKIQIIDNLFKSESSYENSNQTYPHNQVKNDIRRYVKRILSTTGGGVTRFISFEDYHRPNPTPDQVQFGFEIEIQLMEGAEDKTDILKGVVRYDKLGNPDVTVFGLY